jgi:hypothetical protein
MSKIIAKGSYGCVYKPSLRCKEPKDDDFYINKVSKATGKINAITEVKEQAKLDIIDNEYKYHLPPPVMCTADMKDVRDCILSEKDTLLIFFDKFCLGNSVLGQQES